tara:strand:- start:1003 stop:1269 length:267 start_codon:yes stop_codon:yes gene_type:complete
MKKEFEVASDVVVVVEYNAWDVEASNSYDVPPDPSGFEIDKIWLYTSSKIKGEVVEIRVDITEVSEDLSRALNWDVMTNAIEENILNS